MTDTPRENGLSYTPGPWEWTEDGALICHGVAVVLYAGETFPDDPDDPQLPVPADARLIAAAPEMAELLERLAEATTYDGNGTGWDDYSNRDDYWSIGEELAATARALLSRIHGEAP